MAAEYQVTPMVRGVNVTMRGLSRLGVGPAHVLTTTGRTTGEKHDVPVSPIEVEGVEYLVSPYGERDWVKNARANPDVTLRRGKMARSVTLVEIPIEQAAPVLVAYHARERFARRFMAVPDEPTDSDFVSSTESFPVFRVA
jgi:deazaflavin-dependent oxidoreductase (nitroreductase family)